MSEFYTTIRPTDRKLWLLERDDGWGASDAAPASGQSRFKSQYRAVAEKAKLIPVEDISNDPNVRWGVKAERNLAEFMQEDHPDLVLATPQVTYHSKKWPFAFANFDENKITYSTNKHHFEGPTKRIFLACNFTFEISK